MFEKLSVRRLMHVIAATDTIHCAAGKELLSIGDKLNGLYTVLEGRFRVVDDDVIEQELEPGDYFGEASLLTFARSRASLIAIEPSSVILLGREEFGKLSRRLPRVGNIMLRNLGKNLAKQAVARERSRSTSLDDTNPLK